MKTLPGASLIVRFNVSPSAKEFTFLPLRYNGRELSDEWVVATWAITQLAQIANRTMKRYDWDHIDPKWEEGRDYQLICGLDKTFNLCERDPDFNVSKNNRFLPWRVAEGELGSFPVNQGDLCQFLDLSSGEWVLEEFLGPWWFNQTKKLCGTYMGGKSTPREQLQEMGRRSHEVQKHLGIGLYGRSSEHRSESAKKARETLISGKPDLYLEILRKGGEEVNKQKHMCLVTGHISTPSGLSNYQRHRGINLNRRVQLTPEECAFIFLWGEGVPKEWLKETAKINLRKTGSTNLKKVTKEMRSQTAKKLNSTLWISLVTGDISTAAGIHNIHKKAGLDKETSRAKRAKLTPEEAAFIFLWAP